ncbi:semaphorin-2A-like isoform X2 [Tachypleus tridentatus]|uniref:semaphorin-2A-like isoform X2 n=1 Tax=Tachypleus tridentatus TaxID=6853 RepID=UPI003FD487F2
MKLTNKRDLLPNIYMYALTTLNVFLWTWIPLSPALGMVPELDSTSHHDKARKFSCGELYYKTFYLDLEKEVLYVGAMDRIFRLSLYNINGTRCEADSLTLTSTSVSNCISKGKSENYDCRNHIRVIQPVGEGNQLYICGTNAYKPMDWIIHANLTHLGQHESYPGIGNGIAKCPFDPDDNSTAVWVEHGNPGELPGLYSGTVAEFTKADAVIFRTDLFDASTGRRMYPFSRTIKYDSKWLDKPHFVGSYDIGDFVFFFFRESAVEFINCGKSIYSRVARVCKQDVGGKNILNKNWASFVKARLNCSLPGEFPFYFNEIQSVYKIHGDHSMFYTVFTTSSFSLESIQEVFNGKFKEQVTSSSAWLPVISVKVPEPRPGQCVNNTKTLPDSVLNFIRGHPLMDSAITQENGKPVFYKRDVVLTHLVVDKVEVDGVSYIVYYAGSVRGQVFKIVEWYDGTGESHSNLVDVFEATTPEPVRNMEISSKHKSVYVASKSTIQQFDLVMCKRRYRTCLRCTRDPYCGWDKKRGECRPYNRGYLQDVTKALSNICENCEKKSVIKVYWGQSLHLACAVHAEEMKTFKLATIQWVHYSQEKGKVIMHHQQDKYIITSDYGLVVLSVTHKDNGRYDCNVGPHTLCSYDVTVDSRTCNPPTELEYKQIYSHWCREFEKYKLAMSTWQQKQNQCEVPLNDVI